MRRHWPALAATPQYGYRPNAALCTNGQVGFTPAGRRSKQERGPRFALRRTPSSPALLRGRNLAKSVGVLGSVLFRHHALPPLRRPHSGSVMECPPPPPGDTRRGVGGVCCRKRGNGGARKTALPAPRPPPPPQQLHAGPPATAAATVAAAARGPVAHAPADDPAGGPPRGDTLPHRGPSRAAFPPPP